jgi:DNA-binding MarR family transcriptional regulator
VIEQLMTAGRELSTAAVMFHAAVAAKVGLTPIEEKALDLLERFGPLTAGELGHRAKLAPASVTGLINRLERKGFARRLPHPQDRRSVLVEVTPHREAQMNPLYDDLTRALGDLFSRYSDEQLDTILHFFREAAKQQRDITGKLSE